jgi:hypothetical protein
MQLLHLLKHKTKEDTMDRSKMKGSNKEPWKRGMDKVSITAALASLYSSIMGDERDRVFRCNTSLRSYTSYKTCRICLKHHNGRHECCSAECYRELKRRTKEAGKRRRETVNAVR